MCDVPQSMQEFIDPVSQTANNKVYTFNTNFNELCIE